MPCIFQRPYTVSKKQIEFAGLCDEATDFKSIQVHKRGHCSSRVPRHIHNFEPISASCVFYRVTQHVILLLKRVIPASRILLNLFQPDLMFPNSHTAVPYTIYTVHLITFHTKNSSVDKIVQIILIILQRSTRHLPTGISCKI
ncbi:Hypothetical_protein [Hexamita inflata]|uniref:Hypothetical_protein n=1 Tax=Hexamita inflata TaxID=28002 RepID=A0AA86TTT5_9EUKA|nr:Hypothetical protein HINF_LOCUS14352 [Hexamita inflata]CAI9926712.1 Hypothetical protein HINF_LOCUS14357 [Hexamita inflata]